MTDDYENAHMENKEPPVPPSLNDMKPINLNDIKPAPKPQAPLGLNEMKSINLNDIKPNHERREGVSGGYYPDNGYNARNTANAADSSYNTYNANTANAEISSGAAPPTPVNTDWRQEVMKDMAKREEQRIEGIDGRKKYKPLYREDKKNLFLIICQIEVFFGVIGMIFFIMTIPTLKYAMEQYFSVLKSMGMRINISVSFFIFLGFLINFFKLFVWVFGMLNYDEPKRLKICVVLGAILIFPGLLSFFSSLNGSFFSILIDGIAPMAMPGLYIYGALQNMQKFKD